MKEWFIDKPDDINEDIKNEIATALLSAAREIGENIDESAPAPRPGADKPALEFRLRFFEGALYLHTGAPGYDTDHRGDIGAGTVDVDDNKNNVIESINFALEQLNNARAQREL